MKRCQAVPQLGGFKASVQDEVLDFHLVLILFSFPSVNVALTLLRVVSSALLGTLELSWVSIHFPLSPVSLVREEAGGRMAAAHLPLSEQLLMPGSKTFQDKSYALNSVILAYWWLPGGQQGQGCAGSR